MIIVNYLKIRSSLLKRFKSILFSSIHRSLPPTVSSTLGRGCCVGTSCNFPFTDKIIKEKRKKLLSIVSNVNYFSYANSTHKLPVIILSGPYYARKDMYSTGYTYLRT